MNNDKKFLDKSFEDLLKDPSLNKKDLTLDKKDKSAVIYLKVSKIKRNPFQTEKIYSESKIDLLAKSIKENGVVNPIRVRFANNEYQIVTGEKRLYAAIKAGLDTVPVLLEQISDERLLEMYLLENSQKEHISPIEEAKYYSLIQSQYNLSVEGVAEKLGKSRSYVANLVRLLNLPKEVQQLVDEEKISASHVRPLIGMDEEFVINYANEIIKNKISVREVERKVNEIKERKNKKSTDFSYRISNNSIKIYFESEEDLEYIKHKLNLK